MKKIYSILLITLCVLTGCNDDLSFSSLTKEQRNLIGTAVHFDPYVENYRVSRIATPTGNSTNHGGGFNEKDMMYIYRQYWDETAGKWVYKNPPGTIYKYTDLNLGESGVFDKTSWRVYENKTFRFYDSEYTNPVPTLYNTALPSDDQPHSYMKKLAKGDSITWESGSTVRFRAWALSRIGNNLEDKSAASDEPASVNYPDYMVCDWVTVSGPTMTIPLAMRHLGCRLGFYPRELNRFVKIEIATDPADYMRDDNAQSDADDADDKHPAATNPSNPEPNTAEWCAANVKDAFDRMCWPAGVDMDDISLLTCSTDGETKYKHKQITAGFIKERNADGTYKNVKHAQFASGADDRYYLVTIPYDMSNDEPITLPPYTRFKIWLYDVNKGDGGTNEQTGNSENRYHIFRLSDVLKANSTEKAFPDGLTMMSGYSVTFTVGYHYGPDLQVYAEDSFSWDECQLASTTSEDQHKLQDEPTRNNYSWWTSAITAACNSAKAGNSYQPKFEIPDKDALLEFSNLVNGNFNTTPIFKKVTIEKEQGSKAEVHKVRWYFDIATNGDGTPDTLWVGSDWLKASGYVIYNKYTPSIADRPAIIEEDYLKAPFNFYDDQLKSRWTVELADDIDMKDWKLSTIGSDDNPFCGYFDGKGHTLSNLYMDDGTNDNAGLLFGYAKNGVISNLKIVSTHPVSITGTCENERILGCSVIAPSKKATLANKTLGYCYFVGCFHQGKTSAPLVNDSQDMGFEMYGCMQASAGITGAALANITTNEEIVVRISEDIPLDELKWGKIGKVVCNYYDTELSKTAKAFHTPSGYMSTFHRRQYIRGVPTHIMCAKNDYTVDSKTDWNKVDDKIKIELYGAAPWHAMNYAIYMYNYNERELSNKCNMHYEPASTVGYSHLYPVLKSDAPTQSQYVDVTLLFN